MLKKPLSFKLFVENIQRLLTNKNGIHRNQD